MCPKNRQPGLVGVIVLIASSVCAWSALAPSPRALALDLTLVPHPSQPAIETVGPAPTATKDFGKPTETATPAATETAAATEPPSAEPSATHTPAPRPTDSVPPTATPTLGIVIGPPPVPQSTLPPATPRLSASTSLVISQVYGGGGNAGAPYLNDFVELYNLGGAPVAVGGWSVQYASAGGSAWQVTALSGVIPPGGYLLIAQGSGGANGLPLPAPDLTGTINLAATAGKVALLNTTGPLACGAAANDCFPNANLVDFAGYGASANNYEGPGPAPAPSNLNALLRAGGGSVDTDANNADFAAGAPQPRNSGAPAPTATPTVTATMTPTPTPTAAAALSVVINEVAWGGTGASASDEWIELHNPNASAVALNGWTLAAGDGSPSIVLSGAIPAGGYFLLERTDDATVSDVAADLIYTGDLGNAGESLQLRDPLGALIDSANGDGGPWPGGTGSPGYYSMERVSALAPDADSNWAGNNGLVRNGLDANGQPLNGTPRQANAATFPAPTVTPTSTPVVYPPLSVVINEVAWAGTSASSSDEWIELHNPGAFAIDLSGWTLSDGGDINFIIPAGLTVPAGGYVLFERTSDATVSDIPADAVYAGGLNNAGESLSLRDPLGQVIDTANGDGGAWPAGSDSPLASMERRGAGADSDGIWKNNSGAVTNGLDANGGPIRGTPRNANSPAGPPPTPWPATILINEFLPAPSPGGQEFIELLNVGSAAVDLAGWRLDDAAGGSGAYTFPPGTVLAAGAFAVFDGALTGIALNNSGDDVRLLFPDDTLADSVTYSSDPGDDIAWGRLPDGGAWSGRCLPTPGGPNQAMPGGTGLTEREITPIGIYRQWGPGAWATISGRVTVPAPLFGRRYLYIQDETGGIAVYLGRGDWPALVPGQQVTVLGYLRVRSGILHIYVRNLSLAGFGPEDMAIPVAPQAVGTGQINAATGGRLVATRGTVVRLESQAFWIDDGSGPVRVFFPSSTGLRRPKVQRGQVWVVTGMVVEMTATRTRAAGWQIQPRFAADVISSASLAAPTVTPAPGETALAPTEEPTATAEP